MCLKYLWISLLVFLTQSLFFKAHLPALKHKCLYQYLDVNQKYSVDIVPKNNVLYQVKINLQDQQQQKSQPIYEKLVQNNEIVNVHKLSFVQGVYQICIFNHNSSQIFNFQIDIKSGLQLMDLHLLPDNTDAENLKQEIKWLKDKKNNFQELIQKSSHTHHNVINYSNNLNLQMGLLTIILTFCTVSLNAFFYIKFKQTLKQRKLI